MAHLNEIQRYTIFRMQKAGKIQTEIVLFLKKAEEKLDKMDFSKMFFQYKKLIINIIYK